MTGFEWNEHGVCLNPEMAFELQVGKLAWDKIEVEVGELDGRWYVGTTCGMGNGCRSGPVCKRGTPHASREEAIRAGADEVYNDLLEKKKHDRCSLAPAQPFFDWRDGLYQFKLFS